MNFNTLLQLGKANIALPVSLSAMTGYVIGSRQADLPLIVLFAGVFLLACAAMAFNQVQERKSDALMSRTAGRPLPSGRISLALAICIAVLFLISGTAVLWVFFPIGSMLTGLVTVAWYNLVYTPLKRVTAFAAVPGAVTGALPPVIGWLAAGGGLPDHRIILLAVFFFFGQIPHFWLLLMMYGEEYRKAGYPDLGNIFTEKQLRRLTFTWICWSAAVSLFLAFFGVMHQIWAAFLLLAGVILILLLLSPMLISMHQKINLKKAFIYLNVFYLYVMSLLWLDSLL
ncbi:MAG TPA: protoheme IX farnesyltransferase [Bacteroidales bacterium]|nr:protoheme IX farnesyltransferase [Bacteroidales bacterium]HSA44842.1 protoheme IX farnesyltransferase [Bacteroidales bacterium]